MTSPTLTKRVGLFLLAASLLLPLRADVVLEWNEAMTHCNEAQPPPGQPPLEMRAYAMAHLAMYQAIERAMNSRGDPATAGAQAAHDVLVTLLPAGTADFNALLARQLAAVPDGPDKLLAISAGTETATRLLAARAEDGFTTAESPYQPGKKPGDYQFTPPVDGPPFNGYAHYPKLGKARPFVLKEGAQFRAAPPPAVLDPAYAFDLNEVKAFGAATASARTADQTAVARFWFEMSHFAWNRIARVLVSGRNDHLHERARLFAALNVALADGVLAGFESKYAYNFWRPFTAVRHADDDGNPFTAADTAWEPLLRTPPMPDYPSTHAVLSGAASAVLISYLGDEQKFTLSSTMAANFSDAQPRSFARISDAATEGAMSRLYAGIHFRSACLAGLKQGREVGAWVISHAPFATEGSSP